MRGKKIDFYEQDMIAVLDFLNGGADPAVYWSLPPKIENSFEFIKQMSDVDFEKMCLKLRIFNVPSSIYIFF